MLKVAFADFWPGFDPDSLVFIRELRKKYNIVIDQNPQVVIASVFGSVSQSFNAPIIGISGESYFPIKKYMRGYMCAYPPFDKPITYYPYVCLFCPPEIFSRRVNKKPTKFACFVVGNGHNGSATHLREKLFLNLSAAAAAKDLKVDSCGDFHRNNPEKPPRPTKEFESLHIDPHWLGEYKFNICCENSLISGYFTEKPVQALLAGSIPICLTHKSNMRYLNPKAGIYGHSEDDIPEMINRVLSMTDEEYKNMKAEQPFLVDMAKLTTEFHNSIIHEIATITNSSPFTLLNPKAIVSLPKMSITGYVINLDKRQDRWIDIQKNFGSINCVKLERFSAYCGTPGWKYCTLSHQELVRRARSRGDPLVLILEDDCMIQNIDTFEIRFMSILTWLQENLDKWEVFNGGPTLWIDSQKPLKVLDRNLGIVSLNWGQMSHFIIYNQKIYDKFLAHEPETEDNTIDMFLSKRTLEITSVPYLAVQKPDHSDLLGRHIDFSYVFKSSEKKSLDLLSLEDILYVTPTGGFGNLLFVYMIGYSLAKKYNKKLYFLNKYWTTRHHMSFYRMFKDINYINNVSSIATKITESSFKYSPIVLEPSQVYVITGYFQSYKYSEEYLPEIKEILFSKIPDVISKAVSYFNSISGGKHTIMLHLRRGDYLNNPDYHPILSEQYYEKALSLLPQGKILAFSDDIQYLRSWEFLKGKDVTIVDIPESGRFNGREGPFENNIEETFICMTLCDSFILGNSTFSLLAYYFRNNLDAKVCISNLWFGPKGPAYNIADLISMNKNVINL